jgi:hypothetical protein
MLAAATAGSFTTNDATFISMAIIVLVFSIAAMGSLITSAWLGAALRHWLSVGSRLRIFQARDGRPSSGYCIVANDAVKARRMIRTDRVL